MQVISGLLCGLIFGVGLIISGMTDPAKVQNFLDFAGRWDPSLIFVMAGGALVALVGYRLVMQRQSPLFADQFHLPTARHITGRLVGGSALFGIGWGLGGLCPGPAITGVTLLVPNVVVFVLAMLVGMWVAKLVTRRMGQG